MNTESAFSWEDLRNVADALVYEATQKHMTDLETLVLQESWNGLTYEEMAARHPYSISTLQGDAGYNLWKNLREALGEECNKKNFKQSLRRAWERGQPLPVFQNKFYVERPPIEEECFATIQQPGALIRIKAPKNMGKTALLQRIMEFAEKQNYYTLTLNLLQVERSILDNLSEFLRWFCSRSSRLLKVEDQVNSFWDRPYGSNDKCTSYFEEHLFPSIDAPLVLGLNNVDRIFKNEEVAADFLGLLRSWVEDSNYNNEWKKLRLVIAHATDNYPFLDVARSPFNIGHAIELPEFTTAQVEELASSYGFGFDTNLEKFNVSSLIGMVGGHPYLVRQALDYLKAHKDLNLSELMDAAPTKQGLYARHLRDLLVDLKQSADLMEAMKKIVSAQEPVAVANDLGFHLESMGLIRFRGNLAYPACQLYRSYFKEHLEGME